MSKVLLFWAAIGLTYVIVFLYVRNWVSEAEQTGEFRYRLKGWGEQVIRRADDPDRFQMELRFLKAMPWFGLTMLALMITVLGYFGYFG